MSIFPGNTIKLYTVSVYNHFVINKQLYIFLDTTYVSLGPYTFHSVLRCSSTLSVTGIEVDTWCMNRETCN